MRKVTAASGDARRCFTITAQMKSYGPCLALVLLLTTALCVSSSSSQTLQRLHISDAARYAQCPFHSLSNSQFACFRASVNKTQEVFDHTPGPFINAREVFQSPKIQGRTILLAGDSTIRNQFVSLACLLWEADPMITRGHVTRSGALQMIHSPSFGVQILSLHSESLMARAQASEKLANVTSAVGSNLAQKLLAVMAGRVMPIHGLGVRKPSYTVLSVAPQFAKQSSKSRSSCSSTPHTQTATTPECEKNIFDVDMFRGFVDNTNGLLQRAQKLLDIDSQIVWRGVPTVHDEGDSCDSRVPCDAEAISLANQVGSAYWESAAVNRVIRESAIAHKFAFVDVLPSTLTRCDAHVNKLQIGNHGRLPDCRHYCVPGVPDTWHASMFATFN